MSEPFESMTREEMQAALVDREKEYKRLCSAYQKVSSREADLWEHYCNSQRESAKGAGEFGKRSCWRWLR